MASKDISIELLQTSEQYTYGGELLCNQDFSNSTCWLPGGSWNISGGVCIKSSGGSSSDLHLKNPITLVEGYTYEIVVLVKNYNRLGSLLLANHGYSGANVTIFDSTTICNGCDGNTGQYATIKKQWTQGNSASTLANLSLYAHSSSVMTISYAKLYRTAAAKEVVQGRLDASTTDDFPLAITFSVNDPSDIDARKGAYSKTFQIPATKNNNQVLKNLNIANSTTLNAVLKEKVPCRILVGNLFSLVGLMQIKGAERLNDKIIYYECLFLGDNLAWSTYLDGKYLSDLQLPNSTNLHISAENIIKSWQMDDCETSTTRGGTTTVNNSPVVYPVSTYGWTDQTGFHYGESMQLLREKWEEDYMDNVAYNTSEVGLKNHTLKKPVLDWRPMVWIYNMMHKIFNDVGYRISSVFMETPQFKKLLYATPNFLYNNPDQRWQANSYVGNFLDSSCAPAGSSELEFHDRTESFTGAGFPNATGTYATETVQTLSQYIQLGGTCNSCSANDCGSGRFQPVPGQTVNSGGLLQQDLTVHMGGLGTSGSPFYTYWNVDAAGYYDITTANIMFYFNIASNASGAWTGGGNFTSGGTTATGLVKMYGGLRVMHRAVGTSSWYERETVDDTDQQLNSNKLNSNVAHGFGGTLDAHTYTGYFNKGDDIRLCFILMCEMDVKTPSSNYTTGVTHVDIQLELIGTRYNDWVSSNGQVSIELANEEIPVYGGVYDLQNVLPDNQKQLDFVKGVAHAFNLQFNTVESQKTVYIEPFNDFYLPPAQAIDWTWKLARNQSDKQTFIDNDFSRRLIFKYKTDSKDFQVNRMSENYFQSVGDNYPKIKELGNLYPAGERIFENPFFAGTYESQGMHIGELNSPGTNFYAAAMWETSSQSAKGYDFLPRMLYYNKMLMPADHNPNWQGFNAESGSIPNWRFTDRRVQIADVSLQPQNYYSGANLTDSFYTSATFVNRHDYSNQFGLSYGNYWARDYDATANTYNAVGNQVGLGLYSRYYQSMIDALIEKPKVRTCYIDLKISDIIQLDFRRMVYIDGVYYRLIKVYDYQPHLNSPTKVELHQWSPAKGGALPVAGTWINNVNGGGGTYNDDGSSGEPEPEPNL
jgi:hypothetical protein